MIKWTFPRLRPYDIGTEEGRNRERQRRAALTTLWSVFARGAQLAVMLVSMRVALPYLGQERFGVWVTISSLTTVLMIFDFGIGNGMVSRVASLAVGKDPVVMRRLLTTGLAVLVAIGVGMGGLLACLAAYAPMQWLYKGASQGLVAEARGALTVLSVLFGMSIPLQAMQRIYAGLQEGYFALAIAGSASLVSVLVVTAAPHFHLGIAGFLLCTYGIQLSAGLVLLIALWRRFHLRPPRFADYRIEDVRALLSSGGLFFLLQIGVVIGWDMDSILLSALVGPAAVAVYSVVQRLFLLISGPLSMLNAPLWASYADAHARGDVRYLRTTLRRSVLGTFGLASVGVLAVVTLRAPLTHFLSHGSLQIPAQFVLIFGIWAIVSATGDALAMYMNGLHILLPQVVACLAFVVVAMILKLAFVKSYGLDGVIVGSLLSYLMTTVLLFVSVFRRAITAPLRAGGPAFAAGAPRAG